jgi:aminotransferase
MTQDYPWISERSAGLRISAIKEMAMRAAGVPGAVSLAWGLPSFRTPDHIRYAVEKALEADLDIGKYALPDGLAELRRAVADHHTRETGVKVDPDANVVVTAGNMEGLNVLFHVALDPGDEVIVTDPGFASHFQQIRLVGGVPVHWALDENRGWSLDVAALPGLIGPRTRAIVLVTPSNPTGTIFTEAELREVGRIAAEHGILILLDDPYSHFAYDNRAKLFNLSSVPELADGLAYLFTFSKTYAMSGWRMGYMIVPEALKREALKVHDATMICAPRVSQVAALAALTEDKRHLTDFEAVLDERRTLICERLDRLPELFSYVKPEGAYYVFPRILAPHESSRAFATRLLDEAGVTVTPGEAFGPSGAHHVRMAFCVDEATIGEAFDRIERWWAKASSEARVSA